jgi:tetratricopeptide (TPR) repeat protein
LTFDDVAGVNGGNVLGNKKLFLSAVSREFLEYRTLLTGDLKRPDLEVAVQEDFIVTGGSTLEKLDDYIRACDGIIHLIGKASGDAPEEAAVAALLQKYPDLGTRLPPLMPALSKPQPGFSYTQWEAYLAMYHRRPLFVYRSKDFDFDTLEVPSDSLDPVEFQAQREHYQRISALGHDRGQFLNEERLSSAVLRDLVEILPRLEPSITVPPTKLRHTAERLIGRDEDLARLDSAWNGNKNVVVIRAFGGMGKTSLVATWMAELAMKNWRGAERVFDWSFYSQGTNDQSNASADVFIANALKAFGDPDPKLGSAWERGARLARLVGDVRCLLVLDGLEPLQHPPGVMQGKLKDAAIEALLKGLAAQNAGLCVVTTRERLPDIQQHYGRTADDFALTELTDLAGAALLHDRGATRAAAHEIRCDDKELQAASREVRGHGLTLQLLGQYLSLVEGGDILKRDTVQLADADREYQNDSTRPYGHAFKAMEAYEKWFERESTQGQRQLAVLRLLGLFDRPAPKDCLDALRNEPVIEGLTEPLVAMQPRDSAAVEHRLEEIQLLTVQADRSLDAHPLLREYFGQRLRATQPDAWRAAHRRIYEYLCATTEDKPDATLEDLQPLYQAVAHGCHAGMQQDACDEVYFDRIQRGQIAYSTKKLGAISSDLAAVACFFETPWSRPSPALADTDQAWLLNEAAVRLRALGRLTEALEPMRAALERRIKQENWINASSSAGNLSELQLMLGEVNGAVGDAELSVTYADRSGDEFQRMAKRTTHADVLHQAGLREEAEARFGEAEQMQAERQTVYALLYSLQGFQYCDLLLSEVERESGKAKGERKNEEGLARCLAVTERAAQTLKWAEKNPAGSLLDIALDHLTLGRSALYASILESRSRQLEATQNSPPLTSEASQRGVTTAAMELNHAVSGMRRAVAQHHLPNALLSRAWLRSLTGSRTGPDSAQSDLDEAWEIAERGPMPLHLADIHLYRARLFFRDATYPWESAQHDLDEARRLIFKHGYLRRKEELEDAEAALQQFVDASARGAQPRAAP